MSDIYMMQDEGSMGDGGMPADGDADDKDDKKEETEGEESEDQI